jgi:hypothetical protein
MRNPCVSRKQESLTSFRFAKMVRHRSARVVEQQRSNRASPGPSTPKRTKTRHPDVPEGDCATGSGKLGAPKGARPVWGGAVGKVPISATRQPPTLRDQGWRAAPRTTPGGQPWYSPLGILTALTLRAVFRLALRQTEGLIGSIIGLLGLELRVPDHSTLSRRAKTLEVPRPQPRRNGEPLHLLVDSTGLRLCGAGEWLQEKHGTKTRRSW